MSRPYDLLSIGDASVDTYVKVPFIAGPDQKAIGEWIGVFGGGMAADFAAAASNLGARTAFMTVRGDDSSGEKLVEELSEHGVDTTAVLTKPDSQTFQCFVQLDDGGEKALFGAAPAQKVPALDEIPDDLLRSARYVYALADDIAWATALADRTRATGGLFVCDLEQTAIRGDLHHALQLASRADIVFTNVQAFTGTGLTNATAIVDALVSAGVPTSVVTDGARGAFAADASHRVHIDGIQVKVTDSTGAGDAHNGAVLAMLSQGYELPDAMVTAAAMGALCVSHMGPRGYREALAQELPGLNEQARSGLQTSPAPAQTQTRNITQ